MRDNPYAAIISMMRQEGSAHNPPPIMLAEVLSPPPHLLIKAGDVQIGNPNILIADYLLPGYQRQYSQTGDGTMIAKTPPPATYSDYTEVESLRIDGQHKWTDTLRSGDVVAVMPTCDGQRYIILARVVKL